MTPAARRILEELAADDRRDLVRDGIEAYCGTRRVASRVVTELLWAAAIKEIWAGGKCYQITEMGRRYLRRPELEQEYYDAIRCGDGNFTIRDDKLVRI